LHQALVDIVDANWLYQLELAIKVTIAGIFSGIIGFERELANRPAGLRTHALIGSAAALLVGVSDLLVGHFVSESVPAILRADPIRVVEAIVTGTAFVGAGTIFRHRSEGSVEGLTTAASLLLAACIGIVVAMGQLLLAGLIVLLSLILLRTVAHLLTRSTSRATDEVTGE
jgi:putative Mg2+ transporter-C (MgtC) family protein